MIITASNTISMLAIQSILTKFSGTTNILLFNSNSHQIHSSKLVRQFDKEVNINFYWDVHLQKLFSASDSGKLGELIVKISLAVPKYHWKRNEKRKFKNESVLEMIQYIVVYRLLLISLKLQLFTSYWIGNSFLFNFCI